VELQLQPQDSQVERLQALGTLLELQLVRVYPKFMNNIFNLNKKSTKQANIM